MAACGGRISPMTAKELLEKRFPTLTEEEAERALLALDAEPRATGEDGEEPDVVGLPKGWGETLTGEPMPNVVAAIHRSRNEH